MIEIIYSLIASNVVFLVLLAHYWRKSRKAKTRPESLELQEFLLDLMAGDALLHVKRIAPTDVVLRSRRR